MPEKNLLDHRLRRPTATQVHLNLELLTSRGVRTDSSLDGLVGRPSTDEIQICLPRSVRLPVTRLDKGERRRERGIHALNRSFSQHDRGFIPVGGHAASGICGPLRLQSGRSHVVCLFCRCQILWKQQLQLQRLVDEEIDAEVSFRLLQPQTCPRFFAHGKSGCRPFTELPYRSESPVTNPSESALSEQHICNRRRPAQPHHPSYPFVLAWGS